MKLIYSNPVKRSHFVAMKYTSALLTLGLPLLLSLIIGALVLGASSTVPLSSAFLYSLVMFALLSFLYLSVFVLIGLLCSTVARTSKHSLVLSLLSWVVLLSYYRSPPEGFLTSSASTCRPECRSRRLRTSLCMTPRKNEGQGRALRNDKEAYNKLADKLEVELFEGQEGIRDLF